MLTEVEYNLYLSLNEPLQKIIVDVLPNPLVSDTHFITHPNNKVLVDSTAHQNKVHQHTVNECLFLSYFQNPSLGY